MTRLFDNPLHLVLLLVIILIVFGAGKLPNVGSALGQSIKEFKKAANEPESGSTAHAADEKADDRCEKCQTIVPSGAQFCPSCGAAVKAQLPAADESNVCAQCGAKNVPAARFCAQCGSGLNVRVG
jgi:sec-independent protein translocase protein TatA